MKKAWKGRLLELEGGEEKMGGLLVEVNLLFKIF